MMLPLDDALNPVCVPGGAVTGGAPSALEKQQIGGLNPQGWRPHGNMDRNRTGNLPIRRNQISFSLR